MKQNPYKIIGKILSEADKSGDEPGYLKTAATGAGIGAATGVAANLAGRALGGARPSAIPKQGFISRALKLKPPTPKAGERMTQGLRSVGKGLMKTPTGALAAGGAALGLGAAAANRFRKKRQELS